MTDTTDSQARRPQNRLLFWFAATLVPEAAVHQVESPRAAAQRAEILRHLRAAAEGGADCASDSDTSTRHAA